MPLSSTGVTKIVVARATARPLEVIMSVSAEPEVQSFRDRLEQTLQLRREANGVESQIHNDLETLMHRTVLMMPIETYEVKREVERFGGFAGSVQLRSFGETGWLTAHQQLRPTPARGQMVGFDVSNGEAHIVIAETHFRCEWRFNLKHFSLKVVEES